MEEFEEWKDIEGYKNYDVSSLGKIRNKNTGRILKASSKGGYYSVGLSEKMKKKTHSVHQLVAKAFIPNPDNKPQVNHKDKNGLNNNLSNLEWVNNRENSIHRSNGVKQTTNQKLEIYKIDKNTGEILGNYNSIEDAASFIAKDSKLELNNIRSSISMVINNKQISAYGYKWKKVEQNVFDNEEWREIIINDKKINDYFVSSLGRFKNKKGVIMSNYKPHHSGYVYLRVNIKKYALHRLVAQTFIPNTESKPFVNHIDGNKLNNSVSNLEWCTCAENNLRNHNIGLIKCYTRKIVQYDLNMNLIDRFNSIKEASFLTKISLGNIKAVLYKKQKTAGGFIWKYLD